MNDGVNQFCDELNALIRRYNQEADVSLGEMIGILEIEKHTLIEQALQELKPEPELGDDLL